MATAQSSEDEQPSIIDARRAPAHRQEPNLVYGATVQLPTFDKLEPRAWFRIADANFGIRRVTDPVTKYYYVLSKLDSETLRKLSAFLDLPLRADPYSDLRQKLCATFEPPLEAKLDAFLATNDAGDERPAQFGLELQRLLANATTDDLCKRVFLRSIKPSIVTAITGSLSGSFETVMAAADKAWMAAANSDQGGPQATVSAVAHPTSSAPRGNGRGGRGGRGARGGRQRGTRPPGQVESVALCHLHIEGSATPPKNAPPDALVITNLALAIRRPRSSMSRLLTARTPPSTSTRKTARSVAARGRTSTCFFGPRHRPALKKTLPSWIPDPRCPSGQSPLLPRFYSLPSASRPPTAPPSRPSDSLGKK